MILAPNVFPLNMYVLHTYMWLQPALDTHMMYDKEDRISIRPFIFIFIFEHSILILQFYNQHSKMWYLRQDIHPCENTDTYICASLPQASLP